MNLTETRLAEIRAHLSEGENANPSCQGCNEHVLLAEVDRLTAERDAVRIETLWALQPYLMHMGCDSFASLSDPDCSCGLRGKVGAIRALASPPTAEGADDAG